MEIELDARLADVAFLPGVATPAWTYGGSVPGVTQDPVAPGASFRYEFVLADAGTFWYHPHINSSAQVGWGMYGPIVVEDPADPVVFGGELVLMLSESDGCD